MEAIAGVTLVEDFLAAPEPTLGAGARLRRPVEPSLAWAKSGALRSCSTLEVHANQWWKWRTPVMSMAAPAASAAAMTSASRCEPPGWTTP